MYQVKLAKGSDSITVDGITITSKWQSIEKKTKALKELSMKGIIKIRCILPGLDWYDKPTFKEMVKKASLFPPDLINHSMPFYNIDEFDLIKDKSLFGPENLLRRTGGALNDLYGDNQTSDFLKSEKYQTITNIVNSPAFQQWQEMSSLSDYDQNQNLLNSSEFQQTRELVEKVNDLEKTKMMDSFHATEEMRNSSLTWQTNYLGDTSLSGHVKYLMNSIIPEIYLPPTTLDFLEKSLNAQPPSMNLQPALIESAREYFQVIDQHNSFKNIELALNSIPNWQEFRISLEMSHAAMIEVVNAFILPIEEIEKGLLTLKTRVDVSPALTDLKANNQELIQELLNFPPLIEVEEEIETPSEKKEKKEGESLQSPVETPRKKSGEIPVFFSAIKKDLNETFQPPGELEKLLEKLEKNETPDNKLISNVLKNYAQKQNKGKDLLISLNYFFNAYNIGAVEIINESMNIPEHIIQKIPWTGSENQLNLLFNALVEWKMIRDDLEYFQFTRHFTVENVSEQNNAVKIRWFGTQTCLLFLFDSLIKNSFLPKKLKEREEGRWKLIVDHFEKKDGFAFDNKQFSRSYYNMININRKQGPKEAKMIAKRLKQIKSQNLK